MGDDGQSHGPTVTVRGVGGEVSVDLESFERLVRAGEVGPATEVRFELVTGEAFVPAGELELFRGLYSPERIVFEERFNLARLPVVTLVLVALNVAAFLLIRYAWVWFGEDAPLVLGAKAAPLIDEAGQLWRLLTFSFVHADKLHLLANVGFLMLLGLALENAYSRRSFVVILAASALTSGLSSYLFTEEASAGASGIVFGILGGLVVFGVKYRALVPLRYAYYFGWSVLPLLLITIYAGLTQPLVDHAGHAGGLLGGVLACLLLRAELLDPRPVRRYGWLRTAGALGVLVAAVLAAGPLVERLAGREATFEDDLGLAVTHPATWSERGYDELGSVVLRHPAFPFVLLTLGSIERDRPLTAAEALDRRLTSELDEPRARGEVERVEVVSRGTAELGGHPAATVTYGYSARGRRYHRRLYVVTRGRLEHVVALTTLEVWRRPYARTFDRVLGSVRLGRPELEVGDALAGLEEVVR